MARAGLEVFEHAEEILGVDVGFRRTGYVVAVGEGNVDALDALAAQRAVGVETGRIGRDEVAALRPAAYLDDYAAFGWEPRAGYDDGYRTAQAFAAPPAGAGSPCGRARR